MSNVNHSDVTKHRQIATVIVALKHETVRHHDCNRIN